MTESNFKLLQDNKKKVLEFTHSVIQVPQQQAVNRYPPDIKARLQVIKAAFDKEEYGQAISLLDELKDNRLNITWKTSGDLGHGTACRIRDARNTTPDHLTLDAPEKYQMQLINQFRGAVDLINLSDQNDKAKEDSIKKLQFIISKSLEDPNIGSNNIREYNTKMLSVLEDAKIDNAADRLKFATEMSNLKDPHYHIVTLSRVNGPLNHRHTAIEADIMLNGLTPEQKANYAKIANYKPLQNSVTGVNWFDQMDDQIKKALLSKQAAEIARGNKVIPAQFLSNLEGVRNGYMKVTAISSGEEGKDQLPIILSENLHCGAPASKMKNVTQAEKDQIVTRNIEQLQTYLAKDQVLNINILASSTPLDGRGENFIIDQIQNTEKTANSIKVSVSPINKWRWLGGGRDTEVFQETLKTIGESLGNKTVGSFPNITAYLTNNRSSRIEKFFETITLGAYKTTETKARRELSQITDPKELKKILSVAIDAKKLANSSVLFSNSENINLELSSKMNQIENAINLKNGILNNIIPSCPVTVECCKSGKDRTGYVMLNNTVDVINAHFDLLDNSEPARKGSLDNATPARNNKKRMAQAGHAQEMAGIQGGTIGCHSLKTNPEFGLNKSDQHLNDVLGQKSSHFNSTIKTVDDAKQKAKIIEEFKNAYSEQAPTVLVKSTLDATPKYQTQSIGRSLSVKSTNMASKIWDSLYQTSKTPKEKKRTTPTQKTPQRTRSNSF
jgi:hypothetical protein